MQKDCAGCQVASNGCYTGWCRLSGEKLDDADRVTVRYKLFYRELMK